MIHITSEGNLFTPFCISVAGTAIFQHLTVTALIQFQFFFHSVILFIFVRLVLIFLLAIFVGSIYCLYNCLTTVYATVG